MTIKETVLKDIDQAEENARKVLRDMQRRLPGMRNALNRAEIDGIPPRDQDNLQRRIRENSHIEALALRALSGSFDDRAERLIEFFETVARLARDGGAGR